MKPISLFFLFAWCFRCFDAFGGLLCFGGAATVLGGPLGAALFLGSTAASSLGNGGNFNYDKNPNYDYDNYTPQFSKA